MREYHLAIKEIGELKQAFDREIVAAETVRKLKQTLGPIGVAGQQTETLGVADEDREDRVQHQQAAAIGAKGECHEVKAEERNVGTVDQTKAHGRQHQGFRQGALAR